MNIDGIYYLLQRNGYQILNSNIPFIKFFVRPMEDSGYNNINIIGCIDNSTNSRLTVEQLDNIAFQIERKYLFSGMQNVNMIYFIYSDNVERDKIYCEGKTKFWIFDIVAQQMIIYENQPEEFNNLRSQIEELLDYSAAHRSDIYSVNRKNRRKRTDVYHSRVRRKPLPIITLVMVILNLAVFILLESFGSTNDVLFMLDHGAAYYVNIFENHEYYRLITCMFMHFGFSHLLNNMISLWLLGSETERFYGKIKFFIIYMISGIAGSLLSSVYNYMIWGNNVSAGASGAIYGIMGALVVKIVEEKRRNRSSFGRIAFVFLLLLMVGRTGEGIDNIAHIGGFVAGMISGIVCYKTMPVEK